jgi:hypothetical protein
MGGGGANQLCITQSSRCEWLNAPFFKKGDPPQDFWKFKKDSRFRLTSLLNHLILFIFITTTLPIIIYTVDSNDLIVYF